MCHESTVTPIPHCGPSPHAPAAGHVVHANGVVEVLDPVTYTRWVIDAAPRRIALAQCGTCGRCWDDAVSTGITPAPSARCPFEYDHAD